VAKKGINPTGAKRSHANTYTAYECECDCGGEATVTSYQLNRGTRSYGCLRRLRNITKLMKAGDIFTRLTVVGYNLARFGWEFDCSCGKKSILLKAKDVYSGNTKSCGCLNTDNGRKKAITLINNW
jgi:hypothetical protein